MASLAACSPTGTPDGVRASPAREDAPAAVLAAPPPENLGATLARALAPVPRSGDTRLAVAVLDLDSADREIASYRGDAPFVTASVSKVAILVALLLQAQDEGRELTGEEHRAAEAMIRTSDNGAAGLLWRAIGGREGLDAANERLGLSSTRGGPGIHWGLTRTTAKDQVRLLRAVFARGPVAPAARSRARLNRASRAYVRELMGDVVRDQDWGVSAASPRWALKNGWLQRTSTGLWVVNSIGQVTVHGHRYLVSVLSSGNPSMLSGVSLVERAARAAVGAASAHARPWPQ
ncbi:serine hydrolase [Streptomyces sp. Tu 3180]|nr:serine hydrolase [Streptomyces sp. Tu 3180]